MDRATFERTDPLIDDIAGLVDQWLTSKEANRLKIKLAELNKVVGDDCSVSFDCRLDIFENENERCITWLSTGLAVTDSGEPYRASGDSSPQRYIVDGEMVVVPHDRCPSCWGAWDFKLLNHESECRECGVALGKDVKVLLDDDMCPHCEKGKISMTQPKCEQCDFEVDPSYVAWG